jgi:hypothetical protein
MDAEDDYPRKAYSNLADDRKGSNQGESDKKEERRCDKR